MQWTISKSYQRNKTEFIMGLTKDTRLRETTVKYRREQNSVLINNNIMKVYHLVFRHHRVWRWMEQTRCEFSK